MVGNNRFVLYLINFLLVISVMPVAFGLAEEDYKRALKEYKKYLDEGKFEKAQGAFDYIRTNNEADMQTPAGRSNLAQVNFFLQSLTFNYGGGKTKKFNQLKAIKDDPNDFITYNAEFLSTKKCAAEVATSTAKEEEAQSLRAQLETALSERDKAIQERDAAVKEVTTLKAKKNVVDVSPQLATVTQERDDLRAENSALKGEIEAQVKRVNGLNTVLQEALKNT